VTARARRSNERERGAALVEMCIMLPLLIIIAFGIIEFGNAWGNRLKIETAARAGVRVGSNLGADRMADYNLLQSVKSVLTDFGLTNVTYVVVFKANGVNSNDVPANCFSGSIPVSTLGFCNVYTGAQLSSLTPADFTSTGSGASLTCAPTAPDRFWCPAGPGAAGRQTVQSTGADYLGVWIKAKSNTLTAFFGSPLPVASAAVMRLEPKE
jgi:Flp pilus assembly protein TadG